MSARALISFLKNAWSMPSSEINVGISVVRELLLRLAENDNENRGIEKLLDDDGYRVRKIMSREYKHSVVERGSSSESPVHKRRKTRRYVLPTTKLVGQAFERNMKDVWSWLSNDEVSSIGIYGMGGVGKTALATHIHNRLHQERQDIFHHVCWITVSQDFSIEALQDCIVKCFDLDLWDEKDAVVRAGMLMTELTVKKKYVLILDDLWDHFPLEKVGIPLRTDGCKLIFTTRSLDICTKMDCQRIIKVEPLSEGEAWNLFVEKLGHGARLFPETKQIAESVVKECAGLPLGIMTMAGSMKGVDDEYLERSSTAEVLLTHHTISKRQDHPERGLDRGHTILDQLEKCQLIRRFQDDENYRYVKMHDLIWDMARRILNESLGGRVQAGAQLTELPDGTWWRENLNYKLNFVESSFFHHFIRLEVLDLSDTDIEKMPDSICHLTRLTVLLLGWCAKLSYVPSLKKLKALKKLDLSYTGLENLPKGLKRLKDLRYLNLDGSGVRVLRPGILSKLSKLQFLKLHQKVGVFLPVSGHEVVRLRKLETLECNFRDLENFMYFIRSSVLFCVLPRIACKVTVGRPSFSLLEDLNYTTSESELDTEAWFYDLMIDDASFLSRIPFTKAVFVNCQNMRILCPLDGYTRLEILHLDGLMILETLFEAPSTPNYSLYLNNEGADPSLVVVYPPPLGVIVVEDCHNMGVIMGTDEEDRTHHTVTSKNLKLTRIPLTIRHTLKKIQVDPESLGNTIEWAIISEEPVSNPQEDALHTPLGLFRIRHCETAEAGSIFMGLNVDQKALAPTHSPESMHLQL
uniref:Uncharacterized protein n=1 Tax=Salix viminalis TaxID=40686 RepID=A0A6N2MFK1_SALVM